MDLNGQTVLVAPKAAARLGNRLGVGELWRRVGERHGRI